MADDQLGGRYSREDRASGDVPRTRENGGVPDGYVSISEPGASNAYVAPKLDALGYPILLAILAFIVCVALRLDWAPVAFVAVFVALFAICVVWNLRADRRAWEARQSQPSGDR